MNLGQRKRKTSDATQPRVAINTYESSVCNGLEVNDLLLESNNKDRFIIPETEKPRRLNLGSSLALILTLKIIW